MMQSMSITPGRRLSGLVLHPTSLPGRFGIGDLGPVAHRFVDQLAVSHQRLWQVLPLGPTHEHGFSPYSSLSAFAGNPLLISLDQLVEAKWLDASDLAWAAVPTAPATQVDYPDVAARKEVLLKKACRTFRERARAEVWGQFEQFCERSKTWLDDYALFMALRDHFHKVSWCRWPDDVRHREPGALRAAQQGLAEALFFHKFVQFEFARQWEALRRYAHAHRVAIVGDVPIYVAHDAADVWTHPDHFLLEADTGEPSWEAGAPPDVFSSDGQHWGNPLYDWNKHDQEGYRWWVARVAALLDRCDFARLDHFRGFEACWAIPREARSAKEGRWREGPGGRLLSALASGLGGLPLFAEDLGSITPAVHALREQFGLPGMRVAEFGFTGEADNLHLPSAWPSRCVAYTSIHDSDTMVGWYSSASSQQRGCFHDSVGAAMAQDAPRSSVHWEALGLVWSSAADWALAPLQDLLGLGSVARMNVPGTVGTHNWSWRCRWEDLDAAAWTELSELTRSSRRGA